MTEVSKESGTWYQFGQDVEAVKATGWKPVERLFQFQKQFGEITVTVWPETQGSGRGGPIMVEAELSDWAWEYEGPKNDILNKVLWEGEGSGAGDSLFEITEWLNELLS